MNDFKIPLNHSEIIGQIRSPVSEELDRLLAPLKQRISEMAHDGEQSFVVGFAIRQDAQSDPDYYIQIAEMEPAFEIRPYFKAKTSRYKGL